jgi:hypothetical protein
MTATNCAAVSRPLPSAALADWRDHVDEFWTGATVAEVEGVNPENSAERCAVPFTPATASNVDLAVNLISYAWIGF